MSRAWLSVLPLLTLILACAPKARNALQPVVSAKTSAVDAPALTAGPTWDPPATVAGVHIHATSTQLHETEATLSGTLDAKGPPTVHPLNVTVGHCYQLAITLEPTIADAHFAVVDARGHFAATSDAPAPLPTLPARTLTVPPKGALCINAPIALSLSAAAGSGTGKFEATLLRVM
jgi:hypothetical protein